MAGRCETVRANAARDRRISRNDSARGDVSHRNLLSLWTHDVFEDAVTVKKRIAVMVADNHAVVADAGELGVAVHHLAIVQRRKAAVAVNESMVNAAAIARIHVDADDYTIIVERSRNCLGRAGKIRYGKKRTIAAVLEDVVSTGVAVGTQKRVEVVYSYQRGTVVRGIGIDD